MAGIDTLRTALEAWLAGKGIQQWGHGELPRSVIAAQVEAGDWYVLGSRGRIVAALRYLRADSAVWTDDHAPAAYVHGLMVDRRSAGLGIGRGLLTWAERRARSDGLDLLRLDCVESNLPLRRYYASEGYCEVGRADFDGPWFRAALFEKELPLTQHPEPTDAAAWDEQAATFDDEPDHGLSDPACARAWADLLRRLLPAPPARVADLGCGTGSLTLLLATEGFEVTGVDFSPAMLGHAGAKLAGRTATFICADVSRPPLEPASFDAVICRHVLWALPDPATAVQRWAALLRPAGSLILVEGSWSTGAGFSPDDVISHIAGAGLAADVEMLTDSAYWGRDIDDVRYVVTARASEPDTAAAPRPR